MIEGGLSVLRDREIAELLTESQVQSRIRTGKRDEAKHKRSGADAVQDVRRRGLRVEDIKIKKVQIHGYSIAFARLSVLK